MGFPPFSWLESSIGENRSWALARVTIGILYLALGWIPATIGFAVGLVYFFGDITLKLTVNRRMEMAAAVGEIHARLELRSGALDLRRRGVPRLDGLDAVGETHH